ncbi:ComF family protein [Actinospongicola halichondriae]|uniref:ComF family protein n=1 Tax=Actinospongicola halichondriae TaxID=3236844 RepID=UPI003D378FA0
MGRVPALFSYEGVGATVVQALKFRDGRRLVTPLADALADLVEHDEPVVCTWLPTSGSRRRTRGFDQSELLARAVARRLGAPAVSVLRRSPGAAQTGRTRAERDRNVEFRVTTKAVRTVDRPLLVLDDVCTTGATIRAAATALREIGASSVAFMTVARTP